MSIHLDASIPAGPLENKWAKHIIDSRLISPTNKRKYKIIVVGSGLAGASAAASLAELGYAVECFSFHDTPRRAHSVAAQGGINAAKNYQNDGDSVYRLFYDTIKGGDFRAREANVYRLAQISGNIIDQCVAQGVPFARDYGGLLDNRSFGGALVSRTFYARGQTGQQLLLGAYGALNRQIHAGRVRMYTRTEMLDLVVEDGRVCGIITRQLVNGRIDRHVAHAVVLATGGYSNIYYLSTNAMGCNVTATYRAYKRGALFANPGFMQIHPTCIPMNHKFQSKLTLMSESLRNDGRIWVPQKAGDDRPPHEIPEQERDYYLERRYPSYGNLAPRDIASRAAKQVCDEGRGVGPMKRSVYLDFADAIQRLDADTINERYSNLFDMYQHITDEDPRETPMRIYPAAHYTMGGLWVDYNLMSNLPGLFVIGEANFSDHGANRLGASALMQGLADGYFILPQTIAQYLVKRGPQRLSTDTPAFAATEEDVNQRMQAVLHIDGRRSVASFHHDLGHIMWEHCGMARNAGGLQKALEKIPVVREEFWQNVSACCTAVGLNQALERALRVADFLEFAEVLCHDALTREESCGAHFREEYQTGEGEAKRNDADFCHVAAWEYQGADKKPQRHTEELNFEFAKPAERNYK